MIFLLNRFLKKNKIKISEDELGLYLENHSSYPSMHAITDVLFSFDIENIVLEVPVDPDTFKKLPNIFFTLVNFQELSEYAIVKKNREGEVTIITSSAKKKMKKSDFLNVWNGIILVVDRGPEYKPFLDVKLWIKVLAAVALLVCVIIFYNKNNVLVHGGHFTLSLAGMFLSLLLVKKDLGYTSRLTEKFCSLTKENSCDNVLNSAGAVIYKSIKLSDLSLVYFLTVSFLWMIVNNFPGLSTLLALVSVLGISVVFYSFYFQFKIIKNWCPLCLAISSILIFQSVCAYFFITDWNFGLSTIFISIFVFLFSSALWLNIKRFILKEKKLMRIEQQNLRFKRNFPVFKALYLANEEVNTDINAGESEIFMGHEFAPIQILLITNPLCIHCKKAHSDILNLMSKYPGKIQLTFRFFTKDSEDDAFHIANKLISIYHEASLEECLEAMKDIYSTKESLNVEEWLRKWQDFGSNEYDIVLKNGREWCMKNFFNYTPTTLINGRQLSTEYEIRNLIFFIEELTDMFNNSNNKNYSFAENTDIAHECL
jgi:uncharacterized membrane protein